MSDAPGHRGRLFRGLGAATRVLAMAAAFTAVFAVGQGAARADCLVMTTTPVSSLQGTIGPAVTFASTNVQNTELDHNGPPVALTLGTFNPTNPLDLSGLIAGSTIILNVDLTGTGVTFDPARVSLVGTYDVTAAAFIFAPADVSFMTNANDCGSFRINVNPLALSALLTGGTLDGTFTNVLCGTCGPAAPVPEPATMVLLGTGLAGIAAKVRRRRTATPAE